MNINLNFTIIIISQIISSSSYCLTVEGNAVDDKACHAEEVEVGKVVGDDSHDESTTFWVADFLGIRSFRIKRKEIVTSNYKDDDEDDDCISEYLQL